MRNAIQFARGASLMLMLTSAPALAQTNHDLPPHNPACTLTTFLEPWPEGDSAAFLPQMPDARLLPDNFLIAHLAQVMATGADEVVRRVGRFVEESKVDFLIQLAILRRGLIGVTMPTPIRERDGDPR